MYKRQGGAKNRLSYTECTGERLTNANDRDDFSRADPRASRAVPVSYTHLTLPTVEQVSVSVPVLQLPGVDDQHAPPSSPHLEVGAAGMLQVSTA